MIFWHNRKLANSFVSILTYGHESWASAIMTERVRSQAQASEIKFLKPSKLRSFSRSKKRPKWGSEMSRKSYTI